MSTKIVVREHCSSKSLFEAIKAGPLPVEFSLEDGKCARTFETVEEATSSVLNNYSYRLNTVGGWVASNPEKSTTVAHATRPSKVARRNHNYQVRLDVETGVIVFAIDKASAAYDASTKTMSNDLDALKYHSMNLTSFASDPRGYLMSAVELDENSNPIVGGWEFEGYVSNKPESEALFDILSQAAAKLDAEWLDKWAGKAMMKLVSVTKQEAGTKAAFIEKWFPLPKVEAPEPSPEAVPAPAPETIEVVGSMVADEPKPAKHNRKAAKVS